MRALLVGVVALAGCRGGDSDSRCADVGRRVVALVEALDATDRDPSRPEHAALQEALGDALAEAVTGPCKRGNLRRDQQRCILVEAEDAFDLVDECGLDDLAGVVGPELECPPGARQRRPRIEGDGWETWCERDGKRNGPQESFDDDGRYVSSSTYVDDVLDGPYQEDGLSGSFRAGKKHGTWVRSYLSGYPQAEVEYVDGVASGRYVAYLDDPGKEIVEEGGFEADLLHGTWKGFWPGGEPRYQGDYQRGKRVGPWTVWWGRGPDDPAPARAAAGSYRDGERADDWKFWDRDGKPIDEEAAAALDDLAEVVFAQDHHDMGSPLDE